jgi:hypothetical protein
MLTERPDKPVDGHSGRQPQVHRQFAGFEVDRYSFADVPFKVAEPFSLSRQATGPGRVDACMQPLGELLEA